MITYKQNSEGKFAVTVPFGIKDEFKKAFKSAEWDRFGKTWIVGARSESRLKQFIEGTQKAVDEFETAALLVSEISEINEKIEEENERIRKIDGKAKTIAELSEHLDEVRKLLESKREKHAEMVLKHDEKLNEANAKAEEIGKTIDAIINFKELDERHTIMIRSSRGVQSSEREKFENAQESFAEASRLLREIGLRSREISELACVNWNRRTDRDNPKNVAFSRNSVIRNIEKWED